MSTDLYMHSVYYSVMLLEETNYDSYFPCTPEGTNYDLLPTWFYCESIGGGIHSYCRLCIYVYVMLFDEMYTFYTHLPQQI